MEKVKDLLDEIKKGISQTTSSKKDEVRVMRAMINDASYSVDVYGKAGKEGEFNPSKAVRGMVASAMSSAAKIPAKEAEELIEKYEFKRAEAEALVEAQVLRKPTLMRLSKKDDEARRKKLAAFQLAKEAKDPLWDKLVKNRVMEKKLIAAIMKKYGMKAERVAKVSQKEYIKTAGKMPQSFKKAGGADR
jgi:predicted AAA+ superfamily ATPase